MSVILEKEWKSALTAILEELDKSQYKKMLEYLDRIPKGRKGGTSLEKMPQKIIEYYGLEESVSAIDDTMKEIPRMDNRVQGLLRPFVDALRNDHEKKNKRQRRKHNMEEEQRPAADQEKSWRPDEGTNAHLWKKSICDLNSTSEVQDTDVIVGKVIQKSGLRTYETKDRVKKFFFYLAVADETAGMKMMVYGEKYYRQVEKGMTCMFRNVMRDNNTGVIKVTTQSTVSPTSHVNVPEKLEMEARRLIYSDSRVSSITEAKSSAHKASVNVEGTVTEIGPIEEVMVRDVRNTTDRQNFKLKDDTDSIKICMWGEGTKQCIGLSAGDIIKVINLKTNKYFEDVSLNSTILTKIQKVQSVGIQNESIEILGIIKATKKETHLEAKINQPVRTFVVASQLLARAFGFALEEDFEEILLQKIPLQADAVIDGNRIKKITAA